MEGPSCLKDMEVPPYTGEGNEALRVRIPGNSWKTTLLWKPALVGPGKCLLWVLKRSSGGLWRTALVGSGTAGTESGGLELLFLGTLGQAAVLGWALGISACLFLYQLKGMLRMNPSDLGSTGTPWRVCVGDKKIHFGREWGCSQCPFPVPLGMLCLWHEP